MDFTTVEKIMLACVFILPGFVIKEIANNFMGEADKTKEQYSLEWLGYSILNLAVWSWLFALIFKVGESTTEFWVKTVLASLGTAIILGVIVGILRQQTIFRKLFKLFGLKIKHPSPSAWDYKFQKMKKGEWVIVTLTGGEEIAGLFSIKSIASSEPGERDIYIEKVYKIGDDSKWIEVNRSAGMLIAKEQIKNIEFFI